MCSRTLSMPMPKPARGCLASVARISRRRPRTRPSTAFCRRASCRSTYRRSCGTVNLSTAKALPMSLPEAWARRPRLPVGSELACRRSAVASASCIVCSHDCFAPASSPSTTPCHLSGRLCTWPSVTSYAVESPTSRSMLAASEPPATLKPRCVPASSMIVLSMFILCPENASNRASVRRSGGIEAGDLRPTMVSSARPRSLSTAVGALSGCGSLPSWSGSAMPSMSAFSRIIRILISCTKM